MCDKGRLNTFKHVNAVDRIDSAYIRKEGLMQKVSWDTAIQTATKSLKEYRGNEIAFIGSAFATCEDNFLFVKLAKLLGIKNIYFIEHCVIGDHDDILIREDKTPNTTGAMMVGIQKASSDSDCVELLKEINEGKIKALYILEDDIVQSEEWENALSKLELLIINSSNKNKTTGFADIIFPSSTFAEKNGTYVNFQGRIQRIFPAVITEEMDRSLDRMEMSRWDKFGTKFDRWMQGRKFNSKPSWKILSLIFNQLGSKYKYNMAEEVFNDISNSVEEFRGLDYDIIGISGVQLKIKQTAKV